MPREMGASAMKEAICRGHFAPSFQPGPDAMFPDVPKCGYDGPSSEAIAFLRSALERNAAARPTAVEALEHPYLSWVALSVFRCFDVPK